MRLLILIWAAFSRLLCCSFEVAATCEVPDDVQTNRTCVEQDPVRAANHLSDSLNPLSKASPKAKNETLYNLTFANAVPNFDDHEPSKTSKRSATVDATLTNAIANSSRSIHFNISNSNSILSKPENLSYGQISPSKATNHDSARFISEEKLHSEAHSTGTLEVVNDMHDTKAENMGSPQNSSENAHATLPTSKLAKTHGNPQRKFPVFNYSDIDAINESSSEVQMIVDEENITSSSEISQDRVNENAPDRAPIETRMFLMDSNNSTIFNEIPAVQAGDESVENITGNSLLDKIRSPVVTKTLKYFTTDFYPKKILDVIPKKWKPFNSTKNGTKIPEVTLTPSMVYPLVMEGVSILVNRFSDDESNANDHNEPNPVIRGQIVNGVIDSLNKLLKQSGGENRVSPSTKPYYQPGMTSSSDDVGLKDVLNLETLRLLLPLLEKVPRDDLINTINGLMGIITGNVSDSSNAAEAKFWTGILSQPKLINSILQNRPNLSGSSGFSNTSEFAEILKKTTISSAISRGESNQAVSGNLTNIMKQFLPQNSDGGNSISPKSSILRSEFASKVLSKSPIAHLGALDENIKRLLTNSLEKAASRVKINENGEIQINEGMKKILGKMAESDQSAGRNRTSDSLMDVLKSAIASGAVKPSISPEDGKPITKRNVTRHSPLHRKFQQKYGKSSADLLGFSSFLLVLIPLSSAFFS